MRIAVVGVGAILPGSPDVQGFWSNVLSGRDLMRDIPESRWRIEDHYASDPLAPDRTYTRRGAFLDPVEFDPLAFGIPPKTLPAIDTAQLLALMVADRTLSDAAAGRPNWLDGVRGRASVLLGSAALELMAQMAARTQHPAWREAMRKEELDERKAQAIVDRISAQYVTWQPSTFPGSLTNVVAGRIANRFDLHGTNSTTDAACASSLSAISMGIDELMLGRADLVLTGGVDVTTGPTVFVHFSKTPALSLSGDCRPFSDQADGTMLGEGIVMFALRRLADAQADGDRVYGVIRGIGSSSDGKGGAIYAPKAAGQSRALRRAYADAGYGPDTVELVEAHGTGTSAGDAAEFQSLTEVFGESGRTGRQWCALGSVKSQLGHTKCASGAVGLLKALMAVHHQVLPPTIKVRRPDPALSIEDSPFYLNTVARPWIHPGPTPRRAAVSSFGFGGSNFHLTLEEYQGERAASRLRADPTELLLFSAASADDLCAPPATDKPFAELARESQARFDPAAAWRMAILAADNAELTAKLERARACGTDCYRAPGLWLSGRPVIGGGVAFLFPGQGSQYLGMSGDLAMHLPQAMRVWDRVGSRSWEGVTLHDIVFPRPAFTPEEQAAAEARLTATEWAQPALAAHSLVLLEILRELGLRAEAVAGHSFGELVALHAAGVYDDETLLRLARVRGELMRAAAETSPGAMLALACPAHTAQAVLDELGEGAWLVNVNAPEQVTISGTGAAIDEAARLATARGIVTRRLTTSAAFHSPLVAAASAPLADWLSSVDMATPRLAVYGNADAAPYPAEPVAIRERIARQLTKPVRFQEQIEAMYAAGVRTFVEVGAGSVLAGLAGQTLQGREHLTCSLDRKGRHGVTGLQDALGQLAVAGVALDFGRLWTAFAPVQSPPKTRRKDMSVQLNGTSHHLQLPAPTEEATAPTALDVKPQGHTADDRPRRALDLIDAITHRVAEAHAAYQSTVAESHGRFLQTAQTSLATIAQVASGQSTSPHTIPVQSVPAPEILPPAPMMPAPVTPALPTAPVEPAAVAWDAKADMAELLLKVIAELTGYPSDMINQDMDFETDLGIDSIKRVQIMSHVRELVPDLPPIDVSELADLRTVAHVVKHFQGRIPRLAARRGDGDTGDDAEGELSRLVITAVRAPAPGLALPRLAEQVLHITNEAPEIAAALAKALNRRGLRAVVAEAVPDGAKAVVCLAGLADGDDRQPARAAFRAAQTLAKAGEQAVLLVTVQDTGGAFGLSGASRQRCWHGAYSALARSFAVEHKAAAVKAIDCERANRGPEAIALSIVEELLHGGSEPDVGLRADGSRVVLQAVAAPAPSGQPPIDGDSVLVVTGGARGITAAAILEIARRHRPKLLLIGRSPLLDDDPELAGVSDIAPLTAALAARAHRAGGTWPAPADVARDARRLLASREIRATLAALAESGAVARYEPVDVRDGLAVTIALQRIRAEWGPITGIIHAAGVIADKPLAAKTMEQFETVYDTKVEGLRSLLEATSGDPLSLICSFGSVVAFGGSVGQADYAMANEVLAQVASAYADPEGGRKAIAIGWCPWNGGMVGAELAEYFRTVRRYPLISKSAGARAFGAHLSGVDSQFILTVDAELARTEIAGRFPQRAEVYVGTRSHPQLADHCVSGRVVVPLAYVVEWMLRMTGATALADVRVLRPLIIERPARTLLLSLHHIDGAITVSGVDGRPYYRARVAAQAMPDATTGTRTALQPWTEEVYDGRRLFHGPRFQTIVTVEGVSRDGAAATLHGAAVMQWPEEPWRSDVALMDGGLQLPALWAAAVQQQGGLPMGVDRVCVYRNGAAPGPVHGVSRLIQAGENHARFDITLTDDDGGLRAQLLGVEYVTTPDRPDMTR